MSGLERGAKPNRNGVYAGEWARRRWKERRGSFDTNDIFYNLNIISQSFCQMMNVCNKRWDSGRYKQDKSKTWLVVRSICYNSWQPSWRSGTEVTISPPALGLIPDRVLLPRLLTPLFEAFIQSFTVKDSSQSNRLIQSKWGSPLLPGFPLFKEEVVTIGDATLSLTNRM